MGTSEDSGDSAESPVKSSESSGKAGQKSTTAKAEAKSSFYPQAKGLNPLPSEESHTHETQEEQVENQKPSSSTGKDRQLSNKNIVAFYPFEENKDGSQGELRLKSGENTRYQGKSKHGHRKSQVSCKYHY